MNPNKDIRNHRNQKSELPTKQGQKATQFVESSNRIFNRYRICIIALLSNLCQDPIATAGMHLVARQQFRNS